MENNQNNPGTAETESGIQGYLMDDDTFHLIYLSMKSMRFIAGVLGESSRNSLSINPEELAALLETLARQLELAQDLSDYDHWHGRSDDVVQALHDAFMQDEALRSQM